MKNYKAPYALVDIDGSTIILSDDFPDHTNFRHVIENVSVTINDNGTLTMTGDYRNVGYADGHTTYLEDLTGEHVAMKDAKYYTSYKSISDLLKGIKKPYLRPYAAYFLNTTKPYTLSMSSWTIEDFRSSTKNKEEFTK